MNRIRFAVALMFVSSAAWADEQIIGDWFLNNQGTMTEAYTSNDSGSTFGLLCNSACSAYLDVKSECEENSSTPMLINAESGSVYVSAKCTHFPQAGSIRYVSIIDDELIASSIASGAVIGFAIPMLSGEFKVVRFSLNGALRATGLAASVAKKSKAKKLKDVRL